MDTTYTIQEAAQHSGVTVHTLRYDERVGLLAPVGRSGSGYRQYTAPDLARVRFLTMLRATGMSVQQMQSFTALERQDQASFGPRYQLLEAHRQGLMARMADLQRHLGHLDEKVRHYWELEQRQQREKAAAS